MRPIPSPEGLQFNRQGQRPCIRALNLNPAPQPEGLQFNQPEGLQFNRQGQRPCIRASNRNPRPPVQRPLTQRNLRRKIVDAQHVGPPVGDRGPANRPGGIRGMVPGLRRRPRRDDPADRLTPASFTRWAADTHEYSEKRDCLNAHAVVAECRFGPTFVMMPSIERRVEQRTSRPSLRLLFWSDSPCPPFLKTTHVPMLEAKERQNTASSKALHHT